MSLLKAESISKRYGGIVALAPVDLDIDTGEAVGLIGPNGAGKTTLFNCLFGLESPDTGSVEFAGERIDRMPAYQRSRLGIGRTFQLLELFTGLNPRQHIVLTDRCRRHVGGLLSDLIGKGRVTPDEKERADELLELVGLTDVADEPVEVLSLGHGRLVELARAMVGSPKLLMLDEPSSGLDREETNHMVGVIRRVLQGRETAVVLVEHDLPMVTALVSRLVVLESGALIADGPTEEVLANREVRRAYLGIVA